MNPDQRAALRQRIPLLSYLKQHGWKPASNGDRDEVNGLCPLHRDNRPSFYVNRRKNVFFCHGCGQGGDLIRLVELAEGIGFRQALARLEQAVPAAGNRMIWQHAQQFHQQQLSICVQAQSYLRSRGIESREIIEQLGIGYAPGGCLRGHLEALGHPRQAIAESGLSDALGRDRLWRSITFPIAETASFYGRHIDSAGPRHQFPPRPKGGLYGWNQARDRDELIVVEGLFDLASLWQAGFTNSVALLGSHFSAGQLAQLGDGRQRTLYLCLDADANGGGQRAALSWMRRLAQAGLPARHIELPCGMDPNRLLNRPGGQQKFQRLWEQAR